MCGGRGKSNQTKRNQYFHVVCLSNGRPRSSIWLLKRKRNIDDRGGRVYVCVMFSSDDRILTTQQPVSIHPTDTMRKKTTRRSPNINPVRQVGRWNEADWDLIREAAQQSKTPVSVWARTRLLRAARRQLA